MTNLDPNEVLQGAWQWECHGGIGGDGTYCQTAYGVFGPGRAALGVY